MLVVIINHILQTYVSHRTVVLVSPCWHAFLLSCGRNVVGDGEAVEGALPCEGHRPQDGPGHHLLPHQAGL